MVSPQSIHIFCHVIDNLGDVGVCWRLSRQFAHEHGLDVTLWVDDLFSLKRLCKTLDLSKDRQGVDGVTVRRWPQDGAVFSPDEVGDVVIEAFACHLPDSYVAAMAQRATHNAAHLVTTGKPKPAWINLEYLSAEAWVEDCHALPSPHTSLPLTKYFFFPGFTEKTGGLILERDLFARRDAFQADAQAKTHFFSELGVQVSSDACVASLFCYSFAPVEDLFKAMQVDAQAIVCLVPQGVASDAVSAFLQQPAIAGAKATSDALTVQVIPFVDQHKYDQLLWGCDINFVRGEDSFVRAQWAGKPFLWQIYQQEENVHAGKLDAFLGHYVDGMPTGSALAMTRFHLAWNGIRDAGALHDQWQALRAALPVLTQHGHDWAQRLSQHGDLASSLLQFIAKIS
ncbi:MAG: elongation factor P maturation arginine rhamnosyltransferase EarP [Oxalobacter sp.]|nr:MAG: elongation factor P maturation arginine rhamnosyltransferase EarP [Oxalobacter sp.]